MTHLVTYEKCGHSSEMDSDAVAQAQTARTPLTCPECGVKSKTWSARSQAWRVR